MFNWVNKAWYAKGVSFGSLDFLSKTSQVYQLAFCGLLLTKTDFFFPLKFPNELTPCEQKL